MLLLSAKRPRPPGRWENSFFERRFVEPFESPMIPFGAMVEYYPISARDQSRLPQFGKKSFARNILGYASIAGRIWKRRYSGCRHSGTGKDGRIGNPSSKNQCKRSIDATKEIIFYLPSGRWYSKIVRKRPRIPKPTPWCQQTVRSEDLSG